MEEKDFYAKSVDSKYAKKIRKFTRVKESAIKFFFAVNGTMALVFIILIFVFLFKEGFRALDHIGLLDFLYLDRADALGTIERVFQWYPTS
ncbi:MAG: hypothetical protein OQK57_10300, partial [Ignavibacteriaceae bacterium]|nr:hypothetical protein [Ignavibacteriaceae bacterium]